jgi:phosphoribosyl 1,2-cyclic phosphate phosphodiesterase
VQITFLGTGTSQGVPFIGCPCEVCTSTDARDRRLRSSIWLHDDTRSVVIDTGPDFRYQMLRAGVKRLHAVVYTHGHKDHVAGMDDIRAFNYWQNEPINIYGNDSTEATLRREFHYVFSGENYPGIPSIELHKIENDNFTAGGFVFTPIKVLHYKMEVLGFRIGDFSYITDANYIAPAELEKIKGSKILVINALRHEQHISHFTLAEAIAIAEQAEAEQVYFTHISHQLGLHEAVSKMLPAHMSLAYDGLSIEI